MPDEPVSLGRLGRTVQRVLDAVPPLRHDNR